MVTKTDRGLCGFAMETWQTVQMRGHHMFAWALNDITPYVDWFKGGKRRKKTFLSLISFLGRQTQFPLLSD